MEGRWHNLDNGLNQTWNHDRTMVVYRKLKETILLNQHPFCNISPWPCSALWSTKTWGPHQQKCNTHCWTLSKSKHKSKKKKKKTWTLEAVPPTSHVRKMQLAAFCYEGYKDNASCKKRHALHTNTNCFANNMNNLSLHKTHGNRVNFPAH
jgi:hypothetical protein